MDCTIEVDDLNVGMLNRISNKIETYSGKALNVAIGVARLGGDALATGFMFESNGRMFEHALDKEGVRHRFVWNAGSVRVNYKIIDKKSMLTEINDRGDEVYPAQQEELLELVEALAKRRISRSSAAAFRRACRPRITAGSWRASLRPCARSRIRRRQISSTP